MGSLRAEAAGTHEGLGIGDWALVGEWRVGGIRSHRDLLVWQKAMDLAVELYRATAAFPDHERFGLVSQLRRAAVSVPSNIAEGYGRGSTSDYIRFLRMSRGSLSEIDTQLLLCVSLDFLASDLHERLIERVNECGRILAALIRSLEAKLATGDGAVN